MFTSWFFDRRMKKRKVHKPTLSARERRRRANQDPGLNIRETRELLRDLATLSRTAPRTVVSSFKPRPQLSRNGVRFS